MSDNVRRNIAVVFAGGVGSRMGSPDGPKQFIKIKDKPIIIYTLEHFEAHPEIDAIYVSCVADNIDSLKSFVGRYGITKVKVIVEGGASAQESIYNALDAAYKDPENKRDTCVLIHDGVRPIINSKLIDDNISSVYEFGSAISSIPAFETVARSLDGGDTVDVVENRDLMYILQAPQSFRLHDIYSAHQRSISEGMMGRFVDQAHMMSRYGYDIHMIEGLRGNVKITVPSDLMYLKYLIESGEFYRITGGGDE